MSIPEPRISFATENAILLQFAESALNAPTDSLQNRLHALARTLLTAPESRVLLEDAVVGPGNLLLVLHDGRHAEALLEHAEALWLDASALPAHSHRVVSIPVQYGGVEGPDLEQVARAIRLTPDEIIARHSQAHYRVHCLGFLAGFAYLGGLDARLHCARKQTPATRIAPGSIAIGGGNTGIYPTESPGGWHIIGRTRVRLFDPTRAEPALLQAGDEVRFRLTDVDSDTEVAVRLFSDNVTLDSVTPGERRSDD